MNTLSFEKIKLDGNLKQPGVYKIFLLKKNKPKKITRLLCEDLSGLIYIGAAEKTNLEYRLNCFLKSISPSKQNNHSAGNKIYNNPNLQYYINLFQLGYEIISCSKAKEIEKKLLLEYRLNFGEVPPLNG